MRMFDSLAVFLCLYLGTVSCETTMNPANPILDLETELTRRGGFTQILGLLRTTDLLYKLTKADSLTFFAPTDAALARVPADQFAALNSNTTELEKILGFHAVLEVKQAFHTKVAKRLLSSTGLTIIVKFYSVLQGYYADGVHITETNIRVSNGYVHVLDGIMTPPEGDLVDIMKANGGLTTFISLLSSTGLDRFLKSRNGTSVFAPRDSAFAKLDSKVAEYLISHPDELEREFLS
ncbi:transforming growth factor-beta-induced protein ig-h3 [Elysia marginata]|uniref:Transforming growth factor-beta-induced protein ig-h3 n=1 Tax=Elysia marginata TaxID=1093978 RepID=A0AAV4H8Y6_9GAST|nr:transforming growth factor-beta-induced protein ig-h3 [Elysia marginata]